MTVEIIRTSPVADGRYLAFTSVEAAQEWCLPVILLWYGGYWCHEYSKKPFERPVWGHAGPLPVGRLSEIFPGTDPEVEWDL